MPARCFSLVGASVARVTALDGCGRPVYGECAQVVTDGFTSISATAEVDEGETIDVKNANGKRCVYRPACPSLTGYTVEIAFCRVDPDVKSLTTGQASVLDPATGDAIGFRVSTAVDPCDFGFALEVWSEVPGQVCGAGGGVQYGYTLLPFLQGGVFSDFTFENDAVTFTIAGAKTKDGSGWGVGPFDVTLDVAGEPGGLTEPIGTSDHLHVQVTEVAPPEPSCGCIPLDNPTSPAATGAVAGAPGSWTPVPSNRPDNLAALIAGSVVASPVSAWLPEQYVVLEDGSRATWDGAAWEVWTDPDGA